MASSSMISQSINGVSVPVEYPTSVKGPDHITFLLHEPKVEEYFTTIHPDILVKKVTILSEFMFGKRLGFLFMDLDCYDRASGKKLAGVVFLRGDSVACLILIKNKETGKLYFAKVIQPRVPCGKSIAEICAGMVDEKTGKIQIIGVMATEIEEELGIKVQTTGVKRFVPEIQFNYLEKLGVFIPSGGGTRENITTYWYQVEMTTSEIQLLHGKIIANEASNSTELIKVEVDEFTLENIAATNDAKAMCATVQLMVKYPGFVPL